VRAEEAMARDGKKYEMKMRNLEEKVREAVDARENAGAGRDASPPGRAS